MTADLLAFAHQHRAETDKVLAQLLASGHDGRRFYARVKLGSLVSTRTFVSEVEWAEFKANPTLDLATFRQPTGNTKNGRALRNHLEH